MVWLIRCSDTSFVSASLGNGSKTISIAPPIGKPPLPSGKGIIDCDFPASEHDNAFPLVGHKPHPHFLRATRFRRTSWIKKSANQKPFLSDVKTLRERARQNLSDGAITKTYGGDVKKTIEILQSVLATELVCVLRYTMHSITATGMMSEAIKAEFAEHAKEEQAHAMSVAERIDQLGGKPNFNPEGLATRSASQYAEGGESGGYDQGEPDRRTHRGGPLPRTDPLFR